MIIERGVVSTVSEREITVLCRSRMDCQRCAEGKGCGGGILARWLGDRQFQVQAYFDAQTQAPAIGDLVQIGLPASRLVRLAAIMYVLPLVFLVTGLLIQVQLFPQVGDLISVLVATASFVAGFKVSAFFISSANKNGQLLPRLQSESPLTSTANGSCRSINQAL